MMMYIGELIGSFMFMFVGLSINAISISYSKENKLSSLVLSSFGWSMAYFLPSIAFGEVSGPHLNPALTIGLVYLKRFSGLFMWGYMIMDAVGMIFGVLLFYIIFYDTLTSFNDSDDKIKCFCCMPKQSNIIVSILSEFLATFIFVFGIMSIGEVNGIRTEIIYIYVILIMMVVGIIFDYTSVAINPFRDLLPKLLYMILPLGKKEKVKPIFFIHLVITVIIPIIAGLVAVMVYKYLPWGDLVKH